MDELLNPITILTHNDLSFHNLKYDVLVNEVNGVLGKQFVV